MLMIIFMAVAQWPGFEPSHLVQFTFLRSHSKINNSVAFHHTACYYANLNIQQRWSNMHGAANTTRLGIRLHGGGCGDAVRSIRGQRPGSGGASTAALLARVLAAARGGGFPLSRQDARQIRMGHTRAVRRLKS